VNSGSAFLSFGLPLCETLRGRATEEWDWVRSDRTAAAEGADLYRALIDAAPDALVVVDASSVIRIVNRQAESLFGYGSDELLGRSAEMLVPNAGRAFHAAHREQYVSQLQTRPMGAGVKLDARRKDGTEFPVDIAFSSIQTSDGLLVSAAVRDITARVEAERARRLAGGIAHDFNNLLAVILNYADFLAEQLPEGQLHQDVEEIQRAASRAAELTGQLLELLRTLDRTTAGAPP